MRIKRLKIHNYRSIMDLEMECQPNVTFLGPNNHGKSNVLNALEFALSTSIKPMKQDFFIHRATGDDVLWVEMIFNELTEQERKTFNRYVLSNDTICIRKTAQIVNDDIKIQYNGYVEQTSEEWLRADKAGEYSSRDSINKTPLKDIVPPSGRLTKANIEEAQEKYINQNRNTLVFTKTIEQGPLLGQKNVAGGVLPELYFIHAVRDLTEEIKVKATTTFGRLLNRAVQDMAERDPRFIDARNRLAEVVRSLNDRKGGNEKDNQLATLEKSIEEELRSWGVTVNIEVSQPELERLFELGTDVHLDDGVKTTADRKGHGLQRAMIFALLRAWSKALRKKNIDQNVDGNETVPRRQSDSVIFVMEEPELFLHPHAQRKLAVSLREIGGTPEHQVFICTHSTHFVNLEHYKEIVIITKDCPLKGSCVRQCIEDLFEGSDVRERKDRFHMAQWINPDRGEMFFAQYVVFVEGETERVVIPYLAERLEVFKPDVSIIDCGSKYNLPLYIAVAEAFQISYMVIHDEDPLPEPIPQDWNENRKSEKRRTFKLNDIIADQVKNLGRVMMFAPDFETMCGISKTQGEKKGKALAALDHFKSLDGSRFPEELKQIVIAAFKRG